MTEEEKTEWQKFIDGDYDGIPVDVEALKEEGFDMSDPDFDYTQEQGITDFIYLLIGLDLKWLKKYNPEKYTIF